MRRPGSVNEGDAHRIGNTVPGSVSGVLGNEKIALEKENGRQKWNQLIPDISSFLAAFLNFAPWDASAGTKRMIQSMTGSVANVKIWGGTTGRG